MKHYRKKSVVIEAMQLTVDNIAEVVAWSGGLERELFCPNLGEVFNRGPLTERVVDVPSSEGCNMALIGDWVIRDGKGDFYPCHPGYFETSYEEAD